VKVSLRAGFWPGWHARRHAELRQSPSAAEEDFAFGVSRELGLNLIP
jgi:hypothetical protein